jgi:hyperpolarization activated cyclic nucleotide-gated potassium channel 1
LYITTGIILLVERIVCLIWQILGVGFYSFTVGSLSSVLGALDTKLNYYYNFLRQAHLENRITVMDEFCDETNLSKETRTKIRRSLSYAA